MKKFGKTLILVIFEICYIVNMILQKYLGMI